MIVPMRHFDLICLKSDAEATLERLRAMGIVHLALNSAVGDGITAAKGEAADAERAVSLILKARGKNEVEVRPHSVAEILALDEDRKTLKAEKERLERDIRIYAPYGDFDPELARKLLDKGVELRLKAGGGFDLLHRGDEGASGGEESARAQVRWPEMRLGKMQEKLARVENRIKIDDARLAGCDEQAIIKTYPAIGDRIAFEQAKSLLSEQGAVVVVSGWVPATKEKTLLDEVTQANAKGLFERTAALGWGVLLRDPVEGETPPTLIKPPRAFRAVKAIFEGLGISPGYTESDVSVPFMCYFSLFFAMLVGDGGYGAIILALTLLGWRKYRASRTASPLMGNWLVLLTVFSLATIGWGLISNSWFGAGLPFAKDWPTVKWLSDPTYNNMMFLCFTIGTSHLVLARLWNAVCRINSLDCLPEFGWAGVLVFMYFVVNAIVGISAGVPQWTYWLFGASLLLVISRTRGVDLGMLPLNVMSAMGDIISYVRLFAVGYASLQVAQNFNSMALDLALPVWAKIVPMVAILLIGHGINFALAGLSILVHAVRLNTLEFSNHKGLTWSGYVFSPFKKH